MCTVSFLPLPDGGYLLATNRDESPRRLEALPPAVRALPTTRVLAPTDADAGGTWIAVDEAGACLCILNGDRPPATPPEPTPPSRGQLVLDLMAAPAPDAVFAELERRRAAGRLREKAFKLLVVAPGSREASAALHWIEWDGAALRRTEHAREVVAVSSTFEPDDVERTRARLFEALADAPRADTDSLADAQTRWHAAHRDAAPDGDAWCVCMHRPDAHSVSYTQVRAEPRADAAGVSMRYRAGQPCEADPAREHRASFAAS